MGPLISLYQLSLVGNSTEE